MPIIINFKVSNHSAINLVLQTRHIHSDDS